MFSLLDVKMEAWNAPMAISEMKLIYIHTRVVKSCLKAQISGVVTELDVIFFFYFFFFQQHLVALSRSRNLPFYFRFNIIILISISSSNFSDLFFVSFFFSGSIAVPPTGLAYVLQCVQWPRPWHDYHIVNK